MSELTIRPAEVIWEEDFDEIIDVRTPGEYQQDHVPGAINLPILSEAEHVEVGTLYHGQAFEARRVGAAYVAQRIAEYLGSHFRDQPRSYRPLIYCRRGGMRSRSLATVLQAVGWKVTVVQGGYKAYRAHVRERLETVIAARVFQVIAGLTGVGKTALLAWMVSRGYAVLDLEKIAAHRGSLLGDEPDQPQPSQRWFESQVLSQLEKYPAESIVYVESESKRIGKLRCPESLWAKMLAAPVCEVQSPIEARVTHLLHEYDHFQREPEKLIAKLEILKGVHSDAQLAEWKQFISAGQWPAFVQSLLETHYDPCYRRCDNFAAPTSHIIVDEMTEVGFQRAGLENVFSLTSGVAVG